MYDKQLVDVSFWIFFQPIFLDNKKNNIICSFEMVSSQRSRIIVLESSRIERIYFFIEFTNKRSFSLRHYYHYTDSIIWISIMSILCGDRHLYLFVVHWKGYCGVHECVLWGYVHMLYRRKELADKKIEFRDLEKQVAAVKRELIPLTTGTYTHTHTHTYIYMYIYIYIYMYI